MSIFLAELPRSPTVSEIEFESEINNSSVSSSDSYSISVSPIVEFNYFIPIKEEENNKIPPAQKQIEENDLSSVPPVSSVSPVPPVPPPSIVSSNDSSITSSPSFVPELSSSIDEKPTLIIDDLINFNKKELRIRLSSDKNNIVIQDLPPVESVEENVNLCRDISISFILFLGLLISSPVIIPCAIGYYGFKYMKKSKAQLPQQ